MKRIVYVLLVLLLLTLTGCDKSRIEEDFNNLESFYKDTYGSINDEFVLLDKTENGYDIKWMMSTNEVYDIINNKVFDELPNGGLSDYGMPLFVEFTAVSPNKGISISFTKMIDESYLSSDAKDVLEAINEITAKLASCKSYYEKESKYVLIDKKYTGVEFNTDSKYIEVSDGYLVAKLNEIDEDSKKTGAILTKVSFSITKGNVTCHPECGALLYYSGYSDLEEKTIAEIKELNDEVSYKAKGQIVYSGSDYLILIDDESNQILIKQNDLELNTKYRYELEVSCVKKINGIKYVEVKRVLMMREAFYDSRAYAVPNYKIKALPNDEGLVCVLESMSLTNSKDYTLTSEVTFYNSDLSQLKDGEYTNIFGAYIPIDETHSKFILINK